MTTWRKTHPASVLLMMIVVNVSRSGILACHPAEYQVGDDCCPNCPEGHRVKTDCTEFRSTFCLPCQEGTFVDRHSGLKDCITCTTCDSASGLTIRRSCTATSDTVCKPLDGFLCIDYKGDGCEAAVKHKSCKPFDISQTETDSTHTECSECREGTFSNGTTSFTQLHTTCEKLNLQRIEALAVAEYDEPGLTTGVLVAICLFVVIIVSAGVAIFLVKKTKIFSRCTKECSHTNPVHVI